MRPGYGCGPGFLWFSLCGGRAGGMAWAWLREARTESRGIVIAESPGVAEGLQERVRGQDFAFDLTHRLILGDEAAGGPCEVLHDDFRRFRFAGTALSADDDGLVR